MARTPVARRLRLGFITPVKVYETWGHAAPGRGLNETWVGFGIGKNLDDWLPLQRRCRAAPTTRSSRKWPTSPMTAAISTWEIGYFINPQWSVRALGLWQVAHGGVDVPMPPSNPLYPYHDQLAAESYTLRRDRHLVCGGAGAFAVRHLPDQYPRQERPQARPERALVGITYGFALLR